jgi:CheY-like chemotaxis protein
VFILDRADPGSEQAARARSVINRQTEHLTKIVEDLLDVTRIAQGKISLQKTVIDLREVVERTADDFRLMFEDRRVRFRTVLGDTKLWAHADPTRVTQILGNLLTNARKFTRPGDEVTLSALAKNGILELRVKDTGAGIDPAILPHVFDAFVQGSRTLARSDGGLGLGLSLVKGVTELHGGNVAVESAGEGMGAEFTVRLPLVDAAASDERGTIPAPVTVPRRVLVVDDNPDAAESLADVVKMLGHTAEVAYDGPSAIQKVRTNPPDVVLCDIGLPGFSGYDVARTLRSDPSVANRVRLIALTGYSQPEDIKNAAAAGFHRHVAKPCDLDELARLLSDYEGPFAG